MTRPEPPIQVMLRRYPARSYDSALDIYEADLPGMARAGWFPVGQSWGWDPVSSAGFLISGSSWKPGIGTLAVTFRRDHRQTPSSNPPETEAEADPSRPASIRA